MMHFAKRRRKGDPALSVPCIRINTCLKAMLPEVFEVQCKIMTCPEDQERESKAKTGPRFGRMNNPMLF